MKQFENIRLSFGFLVLAGTPPYLVYDVHRLTQGGSTFFHWFNLVLAAGVIIASMAWLFSLRGQDYLRLRSYWERVLSLFVLVASSPVLLFTAILIRFDSKGSAIFSQERVGGNRRKKNERRRGDASDAVRREPDRRAGDRRDSDCGGRPFTIYKLRSMTEDAEKTSGAAWSTGDRDPRVTRIGRFIRKTHLDELPQFFNVFLGQMSIIGPRPERAAFITELETQIDGYRDRFAAPPGITGLAQVKQDADETIEDARTKFEYDKKYIENVSLWFDIKIVFQTVSLIFSLLLSSFEGRSDERLAPKPADDLVPGRVPISNR